MQSILARMQRINIKHHISFGAAMDENTPPSQHEVSMSTYEKDFMTSQEHINKLIRSPPGLSAHPNTPQLLL